MSPRADKRDGLLPSVTTIHPRDIARFWAHVQITDDCWNWDASTKNGYGQFNLSGEIVYAHRLSWEIEHGPIPEGMGVLHHCDNRLCVRPRHLYLGTFDDNMRDATTRKRFGQKLTDDQVRSIRAERGAGATIVALAKKYGTSDQHIGDIVKGRARRAVL